MSVARSSKGHHDHMSGRNRGVVSHVHAQAGGLARQIAAQSTECWSTNSFDDASMWIRKGELQQILTASELTNKRVVEKMQAKGHDAHMPVMNINEHVFVCRADGHGSEKVCCIPMESPAVVLPQANAEMADMDSCWWSWCRLSY